jgi:hypothetical protein
MQDCGLLYGLRQSLLHLTVKDNEKKIYSHVYSLGDGQTLNEIWSKSVLWFKSNLIKSRLIISIEKLPTW